MLPMKSFIATVVLTLFSSLSVQAWNTHWHAVFFREVPGDPMLLVLSRAPCPVAIAARDGWRDAQESFSGTRDTVYTKPACWRRLDEVRITYCISDPAKGIISLDCKIMPAYRFADAKALLEQQVRLPADL